MVLWDEGISGWDRNHGEMLIMICVGLLFVHAGQSRHGYN